MLILFAVICGFQLGVVGESCTMMEQASSVAQSDASANAPDAASSILSPSENAASLALGGIANTGEIVSSASGVNADPGRAHVAPENVSEQEIHTAVAYDAGENFTGLANLSANSTQVSDYDASLNGNDVSTIRDGSAGIISENGIASADAMETAAMHQPSDGPGISL